MDNLLELLKNYSLIEVAVIVLLLYGSAKWIYGQVSEFKKKSDAAKQKYHEEETAKSKCHEDVFNKIKEVEEKTIENETKLAKDYERIQKAESHLYQIENNIKEINSLVTTMRIQSLRSQILDFTDKAVNLDIPVSIEAYSEIDRIYKEYKNLIVKSGKENGYVDYSYKCILQSLKDREANKKFLENYYVKESIYNSSGISSIIKDDNSSEIYNKAEDVFNDIQSHIDDINNK